MWILAWLFAVVAIGQENGIVAANQICNWTRFDNTQLFGGSPDPAKDLTSCQNDCAAKTGCQGIDWDSANKCWLHKAQQVKTRKVGVVHYDYSCKDTPCSPNPCQNGGTFTPNAIQNTYTCTCPSNYAGKNCETLACTGPFTMTIEVDDSFVLYVDGVRNTNTPNANKWNVPDILSLSCVKLLAIKGVNNFGIGGIMVKTDDGWLKSNSTWSCTNVNVENNGWQLPTYDDSSWPPAVQFVHSATAPNYIWAAAAFRNGKANVGSVYCRKRLV